jgi:hypothetical protein
MMPMLAGGAACGAACCWQRVLLFALVASAHAFENAQMRKRRRTMTEAISYIKFPEGATSRPPSEAEVRCSACEAVARELMDNMNSDKHKGGTVARLNMLVSTCDKVDRHLPQEMPPLEDGGPRLLHFFPAKQLEKANVGLGEFCTAFVEEYESELDTMIAVAKPVMDTSAARGMPRYVQARGACLRPRHVRWRVMSAVACTTSL